MTPWDTDLIKVGSRNTEEITGFSTASNYGDVILIIKDRGNSIKMKPASRSEQIRIN